jgi:hypothetical protein
MFICGGEYVSVLHGLHLGSLGSYRPLRCAVGLEQHAVPFTKFSGSNECAIAHQLRIIAVRII